MCDTITVLVVHQDMDGVTTTVAVEEIAQDGGKCLCNASEQRRAELAAEAVKRLWPKLAENHFDRRIVIEVR